MLLWSALFGMRALMAALNNAYGEVETRGFLALNGLALLLGLGASVLVVASIGILTAGPALVGALAEQSSRDPSLGPAWAMAASVGRWPLVGVIIVVALSVCYRVAPCRSSRNGGGSAGARSWPPPCGWSSRWCSRSMSARSPITKWRSG